MNLSGIKSAEGLRPREIGYLDELVQVLEENYAKHQLRRDYYYDKVSPKWRGPRVSRDYRDLNTQTGWAAKTVNQLAERSVFDSFTFIDEPPLGFDDVIRECDVDGKYQMAMPSMLIEGVGFWTVCRDADTREVMVNYNNAMTASATWDWKHGRIKAGMVVNDFARFGKSRVYVPSEVVLYCDDCNVVLTRGEKSKWTAEYYPHIMGEPMMVPMVYKKADGRPFGKSRISKACMGYIDDMMGELLNCTIQADFFSVPMKYVTGLSDEQYDGLSEDLYRAYRAEMMLLTTNDEGSSPGVSMLQGADMTPHIAYMDKLANLMAAETCLPVATFGVAGNGYTSSDALRASSDDLVLLAKSVNRANAETMEKVARMVCAVLADVPLGDLDEVAKSVTAHFQDPAMQSDAVSTDSVVKICSVVPEFAGTSVFWEKLGYPEDDRRRIDAEMASEANAQLLSRWFDDSASLAG